MWKVEASGEVHASREEVWAWYEATDDAPTWDPLIKRIECDGPLEVGVRGRNHPTQGPAAAFEYTEVTRLVSYTEVSSAPGAKFAFTHLVGDGPEGTLRLTHGAEVSGPLSSLYRLVFERNFERGMRLAMDNLIRSIESGPPPSRPSSAGSGQ